MTIPFRPSPSHRAPPGETGLRFPQIPLFHYPRDRRKHLTRRLSFILSAVFIIFSLSGTALAVDTTYDLIEVTVPAPPDSHTVYQGELCNGTASDLGYMLSQSAECDQSDIDPLKYFITDDEATSSFTCPGVRVYPFRIVRWYTGSPGGLVGIAQLPPAMAKRVTAPRTAMLSTFGLPAQEPGICWLRTQATVSQP